MKENKINLTEKDFEFICPVKSSEMIEVEKGYFCGKCEKKVYDVSDYTQDEFHALKTNTSGLCINFKKIVTTSLILNATLCVAVDTTGQNRLAPLSKFSSNQIVFKHNKVVEMGGGGVPITIFEPDGDMWVPVERPPSQEDDNKTKGSNCKGVI